MIGKLKRKIKSIKARLILKPVFWGNLRHVTPFSTVFGYDRGTQSIARYYIDNFMANSALDIKGSILEIGDDTYTNRFGHNIVHSDVLHVVTGNPKATIVTDLCTDTSISENQYDCIIMPQTLQFIYDFRLALKRTHEILKPGGALLVTLSGISQISKYDMERWGEYWRFTSKSTTMLFEEFFPSENIQIETHGNLLSAIALLEGLASRELKKSELDFQDSNYEVTITVRAIKGNNRINV
ncbi:MAG: methyltransferase domain-containing protein [Paludibacter sp.]|nr:methyltransferase domain-containing protein [Paludibacter sp.]